MTHSIQEPASPVGAPLLDRVTRVLSVLMLLSIATIPWLWPSRGVPTDHTGPAAPSLAICTASQPGAPTGFLRGRLYGDLEGVIDSSGLDLRCGGGLRPDGRGIRLVFAPGSEKLLFVIGFPSIPDGAVDTEQPVNLTIVDERSGRFYNSGAAERCWARLGRFVIDGPQDRDFELAGELYCAGALAAVNNTGSVTPGDFIFAGRFTADPE